MKQTLIPFLALTLLAGACKKKDGGGTTNPTPTDLRAKFVKTWNTTRTCVMANTMAYQMTINKNATDTSKVVITNVLNEGASIVGIVTAQNGNRIDIPSQQYGNSATDVIAGYIDLQANNTITGSLQMQVASSGDQCGINGY